MYAVTIVHGVSSQTSHEILRHHVVCNGTSFQAVDVITTVGYWRKSNRKDILTRTLVISIFDSHFFRFQHMEVQTEFRNAASVYIHVAQ